MTLMFCKILAFLFGCSIAAILLMLFHLCSGIRAIDEDQQEILKKQRRQRKVHTTPSNN